MKNFYRTFFLVVIVTLYFSILSSAKAAENPRYARAEIPTPVLNTSDFRSVFGGTDGKTLKRDSQGLIRAVEFVALPGTVFQIENGFNVNGTLIYQVNTTEYPPQKTGLYIDSRFVSVSANPIPARSKTMPSKQQILEKMARKQGLRYVWGGNISQGIPELFHFYSPSGPISLETQSMWALHGLDCSGLLYEAANGATPRNTSDLISFGKAVTIQELKPAQIAKKLQPLDLITWKGHVIIVLDQTHTIESCVACSSTGGVTIRNLRAVLEEIMRTRKPFNEYPAQSSAKPFVVRRWI